MNVEIRVYYPLSGKRITLRTDADWDLDLEPVEQTKLMARFIFESERPIIDFKPLLHTKTMKNVWAQGENYTVYPFQQKERRLYPHFLDPAHGGTISRPLKVPTSKGFRRIRIYKPPGYNENYLKRYPVLYMHDGTNLFFPEEAFLGQEWHVDENMDLLNALSIIDKTIVVGIYAGRRNHEYTKPGYKEYGESIVKYIKPYVDRHHRTLANASKTMVMGSSLGGVVSFYLAWQYPHVFGKAICMSSTFGYKDDLYDRVLTEEKRPIRIYLDSGWPKDNFEETRHMRDLLLLRGFEFGKDLLYFAFPRHSHGEKDWGTRSHLPFQFMFGKRSRTSGL